METLDLTKILAGCPKGTLLYSTIHGYVAFEELAPTAEYYPIMVTATYSNGDTGTASFARDGRFYESFIGGECTLFPSKECRDWSQFKQPQQEFKKGDHILWHNNDNNEFLGVFVGYTENEQGVINLFQGDHYCGVDVYIKDLTKVEKFDPKMLKTGDAVLVRDNEMGEWSYSLFSHIREGERAFCASCCAWRHCVPYNQETQYMIGMCCKAPKFYDLTDK